MDVGTTSGHVGLGLCSFVICLSNFKIMDDSLIFQYVIIAVIVVIAGYSLFKVVAKNFSTKKFKKSGKPGCDSDCGCS
jgi:hypothetical protein